MTRREFSDIPRNICLLEYNRMVIAVFDTHHFDRAALEKENARLGHELRFFETRLDQKTAKRAAGSDAVCVFVNDVLDRPTLTTLRAETMAWVANED